MNKINLLLIGLGPHSKRIYIPALRKNSKAQIRALVELMNVRKETEAYLKNQEINLQTIYTEKFTEMPEQLEGMLSQIILEKEIKGVIIATEPTSHLPYAKWALKNNLNILIDKPITTYDNVSQGRN